MFGRWRKQQNRPDKQLADKDPDVRLRAIAALDETDEAAQTEFKRLAANDPDQSVRQAAIARITDASVLNQLRKDSKQESAQAAALRLAHLAAAQGHVPDDPDVLDAFLQGTDPATLSELSNQLIPRLNASQLAELAVRVYTEHKDEVLKQPLLRTADGLAALEKQSRNRDKTCNRHARRGLEVLREAQQTLNAQLAQISEIDDSIERAKRALHDAPALNESKIRTLLNRRLQLAEAYAQCLAEAAEHIETDGLAEPLPAAPLDIENLVVPEDPYAGIAVELDALQRLGGNAADALTQWQQVSTRWADLVQQHKPPVRLLELEAALTARFTHLERALNSLSEVEQVEPAAQTDSASEALKTLRKRVKQLRALRRKIDWPEAFAAPPALARLDHELTVAEAEVASCEQRLSDAQTQYEKAYARLVECLDAQQYQPSVQAIKQAREKCRDLPPADRTAAERDLAAMSARLGELQDWQKFATDPKREHLLTEIENLANEPLEPPTQAARLRELRTQWRQLGHPKGPDEIALQTKFDAFAEAAYAPCEAYYAEQAELRGRNLAARKDICEQLKTYLDTTDFAETDLKAAEQIMRTARDEWRRFHPCERKALKPLEAQFEALQARLHSELKTRWDQNVEARRQIIQQAQNLLDDPGDQAPTEQAKRLQAQWKQTGPAPRAVDQRLWREFRAVCDQIFQRRQAEYAEQVSANKAAQAQLDTLLDAYSAHLEQAKEAPEQASQANRREHEDAVAAACQSYQPTPAQRSRLNELRAGYDDVLRARAQQAESEKLEQMLTWDAEVTEAEQTQSQAEAPHPFFAQRVAGKGSSADLLELVLEAEIAADLASPPEDQEKRMAMQIEFMNQGVRNLRERDYRDVLERWCKAGPKGPEADAYRNRLRTALRAWMQPR